MRETVGHLTPRIKALGQVLQRHGILTTASTVDSADYITGIVAGLQALGSAFFRPNILFLHLPRNVERHPELRTVISEAARLKIGVMLLGLHEDWPLIQCLDLAHAELNGLALKSTVALAELLEDPDPRVRAQAIRLALVLGLKAGQERDNRRRINQLQKALTLLKNVK